MVRVDFDEQHNFVVDTLIDKAPISRHVYAAKACPISGKSMVVEKRVAWIFKEEFESICERATYRRRESREFLFKLRVSSRFHKRYASRFAMKSSTEDVTNRSG